MNNANPNPDFEAGEQPERRAAARSETDSRAFLQSALDALKSHICILDREGRILAVNAAWRNFAVENAFSSPDAGVGLNYLEVCARAGRFGSPDAALVADGIRAVMNGRDEFYLEYPCHTPHEKRWFGVRVTPFSGDDANEGPRRVVVAHENISARREAQDELQESETRYRQLADFLPSIVFAARPDGACTYCNARWYEFTGQNPDQSLSDGWSAAMHPNDLPETRACWLAAKASASAFNCEYRLRRADGVYRWHQGAAVPTRDGRGRVTGWFGTATDVHERHEAEVRASLLAEASAVLSSSLEPERELYNLTRLCVPRLADWCAVHLLEGETLRCVAVASAAPQRATLAREMDERYPPKPETLDGFYEVVRTRKPALHANIPSSAWERVAHNAEHLQTLLSLDLSSLILAPLEARGGVLGVLSLHVGQSRAFSAGDFEFAQELARAAALFIDNARLFAESERARETAEAASRAKDEFLAVISHELRTPLTPMLGWVQMLRMDDALPEGEERMDAQMRADALASIERNARAQAQLVNDLLDVSRITTGKLRLQLRKLDLREVLHNAMPALRPTAQARNVNLREEFQNCACYVMGDPDRLQQVVWNLVSNAASSLTDSKTAT